MAPALPPSEIVDPVTANVPAMETEPEVAPLVVVVSDATNTATLLTTIDTDDVPVVLMTAGDDEDGNDLTLGVGEVVEAKRPVVEPLPKE